MALHKFPVDTQTEPVQTLASNKCLLFVCKEDPMVSSWIHNNKWLIFNAWLKPHLETKRGLSSQKSAKATIISHGCLQPNLLESSASLQMLWSEAPEESSYYGSVQVCVLQNVFVSLPPSPGCAQTASLQLCLSFCPLQQTPAETENQSLLQSPIICNPQGTQIHTTWPKKNRPFWYQTSTVMWPEFHVFF